MCHIKNKIFIFSQRHKGNKIYIINKSYMNKNRSLHYIHDFACSSKSKMAADTA